MCDEHSTVPFIMGVPHRIAAKRLFVSRHPSLDYYKHDFSRITVRVVQIIG